MPNLTQIILFALLLTPQAGGAEPAAAEESKHQIIGRNIFGLITDFQNDPVLKDKRALIDASADDEQALSIEGRRFTYSSFKQDIGSIYLSSHNPRTGDIIDTTPIDASSVGGVTQPGANHSTPWNTMLISEENLVDAANPAAFSDAFKAYFKDRAEMVNPYAYGWPVEVVTLNSEGESKLVKHYAIGRLAASQILPMPDQRSVYFLDGGHSGFLYLFVAKEPQSLSDGTLYIATGNDKQIRWEKLADTSSLKAKFKLRGVSFEALIEKHSGDSGTCPDPFKLIESAFGRECIRIKDKNFAGLFEPVRTGALLGGASFAKGASSLEFIPESNTIVISQENGRQLRLPVGAEESMETEFLIRSTL